MRHHWIPTVVLIATAFAGCASHSGIVSMGGGAMLITKQAATGFPGLGNMKAEVLAEASSHCTAQSKAMEMIAYEETKPPYVLGNYPRVELQFRCK